MKSSPKSNEIPLSAGSKTPASGKKLVQARLPFKTLGGSEAPFSVTNDTSDATSLAADNRKRKPNDDASNENGIRAAKLNRSDNISLETSEILELSNDFPTESETANGKKFIKADHTSESKENVCDAKHTPDKMDLTGDDDEIDLEGETHEPKAKQSLDFERKHLETRKSKRINESSLIKIKLPMTKKAKEAKAKKKVKKHKKTTNDDAAQSEIEEDEAKGATTEEDEDEEEDTNTERNVDVNVSTTMAELEIVDHSKADSHDEGSELNDSVVSIPSEQCSTPTNHKLTPKQMQRRLESEKKKLEKEQARLERERKLQEEKEMRQREKEEKELQKKREREEKGIETHFNIYNLFLQNKQKIY